MALIILEGLDRTGKTSVAKWYEDQGYEVIHMSAPPKGTVKDQYVGEMVDLLSSLSGKDVVLDRSHYGELVWPQVYGRQALLDEEDIEVLKEIEDTMDPVRILMHDTNSEAHWQRCVDNNEPLTKVQFVKARNAFSNMADKYGFLKKTLKDFPEAANLAAQVEASTSKKEVDKEEKVDTANISLNKTPQQLKLDKANAINEVLAKRIIKSKGPMYDDLERSIRGFLNNELAKIFGQNQQQQNTQFSNEEVELLKFFVQRLKEKNE